MPRMIIVLTFMFDFKKCLGINFTETTGSPDIPFFRLVDMYTSVTDQTIKEEIIRLFTTKSHLRVVVATSACSMGIDCKDVREVVHWGHQMMWSDIFKRQAVVVEMVYHR